MKLELNSPQLREVTEIPIKKITSPPDNDDSFKTDIYVFNDYEYNSFRLIDNNEPVSEFYINDEEVKIKPSNNNDNTYEFKSDKPIFIQCFSEVRIKLVIAGKIYISDSISVMVTNNSNNKNIIKMIEYICDYGEDYLYGNYINPAEINENKNLSIKSKFEFLDEILSIYEKFFSYFQNSPKTKLISGEVIGKFHKLNIISPQTIQYIASHPEELYEVDFYTGINYGQRHFQPENTLVSNGKYSCNIYENRIITGFISTVILELENSKKNIKNNNIHIIGDYFESKKIIDSFIKRSSDEYINKIDRYIESFQILWFRYKEILNSDDIYIDSIPEYTDTFRLVTPYSAIYQKIYEWFHYYCMDNSEKNQTLLSFTSTSKIYEYYCLIKLITTIRENLGCTFIAEKTERFNYDGGYKYYSNTYCNNTFFFKSREGIDITLYFQPVIYGDGNSRHGIGLYRSRSANFCNTKKGGNTYTPDYLIKVTHDGRSKYVIIDAKYSSVQTVENNRLMELVYKYLFSVSPLSNDDIVEGLLIFCGKDSPEKIPPNMHDVSEKMQKSVTPFSYIVNLSTDMSYNKSNTDASYDEIIKDIFSRILS